MKLQYTCSFSLWNALQGEEWQVVRNTGDDNLAVLRETSSGKLFYTFVDETENYYPTLYSDREECLEARRQYCIHELGCDLR